jgi:hypothetical protein
MDGSVAGFEELTSFVQAAPNVNVLVAADTPDMETPNVERLGIMNEVQEEFRVTMRDALPQADEILVRSYEAGYTPPKHELLVLELVDADRLQSIVNAVEGVSGLDEFDAREEMIARLRFYVVVFDDGTKSAVFFRRSSPQRELIRSGLVALVFQNGVYNRLHDRTFLFDRQFDCFSWDGRLYIRSVGNFHHIFRYLEQLKLAAEQTLDTVIDNVPVANLEEFREACTSQLPMMAKLAAISNQPYLKDLTMDAIKQTIEENSLDIDVVTEDGTEKLVFDKSIQKRWLILKVLDDDFLKSLMTNRRYEVNSKVGLSGA